MCFINQRARIAAPDAKRPPKRCPAAVLLQEPGNYIERAITIRMISFEPPKMRVIRLSRYIRAIG
jgi:hypothetical protein